MKKHLLKQAKSGTIAAMLSLNEIRSRAVAFAKEHEHDSYEKGDTHKFWIEFFGIFGVHQRRIEFEKRIKIGGQTKFIDAFLGKEKILIEQKSLGQDLDLAFAQARNYLTGLPDKELPKYILISDFQRFHLYDLDTETKHEFTLDQLPKRIELFGFISGYQKQVIAEEDPVNIKAAKLMGELHDELAAIGYSGHDLEVFLVRVLFVLFAEDSQGIFEERHAFRTYIRQRTADDGSDLGRALDEIFDILNTPPEKRLATLDESLAQFPYINGRLFAERLNKTAFNRAMRDKLLKCCEFDWSRISPAVFGSLFQYVMDPAERRDLGAHYTDEVNILKVIEPLFLDGLWTEFERAKTSPKALRDLHDRIAKLKFFDPACGCGNFLIITYREIRRLELEILKILEQGKQVLDIAHLLRVDVDNFYGIEIGEFSAEVAKVAMWLMDHQANERAGAALGQSFARIPLRRVANIYHANALRIDWQTVLPANECSYIVSNPPFYGHHLQTAEQKSDLEFVFHNKQGIKVLDYVSCWYKKAAEYILNNPTIEVGFVSTNSIAQGEQVGILWEDLLATASIKINFAHQTFKWNNQASSKAQVFVVIIGFGLNERKEKWLYEYDDVRGEPHKKKAKSINPYLVDGNVVLVRNQTKPLCHVPAMMYGNKPTDNGNFIFSDNEKSAFLSSEPAAEKWVRRFIGANDFINNENRWCLWLEDISPDELRQMPEMVKRIQKVAEFRSASKAATTREFAKFPTLFRQRTQPKSDYILIPRVSSEKRKYIPMGFFTKDVIVSDTAQSIPGAGLYHFGVLTSAMHMAWVRYTCGRLKGDYRYSKDIVYNNFPWPDAPSAEKMQKVEKLAQAVLDTRAKYPESSLADLYDPLTMPPDLVKAHTDLDRAVDLCYRPQAFENETGRVAFLFERYEALTAPLLREIKKKR